MASDDYVAGDYWTEWIKYSARLQGGPWHKEWPRPKPPPRKCLAERTAAAAAKRPTTGRQSTLLSHNVRPARWATACVDLNVDILELVARKLMRAGEAKTLRALAVVNRETAAAVRNVLRQACQTLRAAAIAYAEVHEEHLTRDKRTVPDELLTEEELDAADAIEERRVQALNDYILCMAELGIPEGRQNVLVNKPWCRWFHNSRSMLGHLQNGCEFCSSEECRDSLHRAGPVALSLCRECAATNRVRFTLHKGERDTLFFWINDPNDKLLVRFPRCDSEANNYACALMSKRESRRRRWSGRRMPVARRTVKLSRRVHYQNWNRTLAVEWESFLHDHHLPGSEPDEMEFELFHTLPAPIPKELCFAGVMGLRTNDETRHQAMEHSDARRRARAIIDKRRADFNRISRKYKSLIERVNRTVHERGFRAWINVIEMCSAARAFELRWLFRAEESRFGNWRMARYHLLDMDPVVLEEATHRVSSVQTVLRQVLEQIVWLDGSPVSNPNSTRLCVLEILKHLPVACLSPGLEHALYAKVQHLRSTPVALSIRTKMGSGGSTQQLTANFYKTDPSILGRPDLVLVAYVTRYTVVKLCSLTKMPDPGGHRLTREIVDAVGMLANGYDVEPRDRVRTELFALPGAWPFAATWLRNS